MIQPSIHDLRIVNENFRELTTELGESKQVQAMELSATPSGHGKMELPQGLNQRSESEIQDELIHMTNQIDDYAVEQVKEFGETKLLSARKEGLQLDKNEDEQSAFKESRNEPTWEIDYLKKIWSRLKPSFRHEQFYSCIG